MNRRITRGCGLALALAALLSMAAAAPALADNYSVKDGNGALQTFAAKLVSSVLHPLHLWEVCIDHGACSAAPVPVNGDPAGNIGMIVAGFQTSPTITVQNASYSAGNSEGGLISATVSQTNGGNFTLGALRLTSAGGSTNTVWIYAWSKSPSSTCTDKSAFSLNTADKAYALPGFPMQVTLGGAPGSWDTQTYAQVTGLAIPGVNQDSSASKLVYFCLVTAGSVTPAATTDLSLNVNGWN